METCEQCSVDPLQQSCMHERAHAATAVQASTHGQQRMGSRGGPQQVCSLEGEAEGLREGLSN